MKAFIITLVVPNEWDKEDAVTAMNLGVRKHVAESPRLDQTSSIIWSAMVADSFDLKRQDI